MPARQRRDTIIGVDALLDIATADDPVIGDATCRDDRAVELTGVAVTPPCRRRAAALRMLVSFVATMLGLRALTFGQQTRILPVPDVAGGGIHVHHFVWGIVILAAVAFCGLMTPDPGANMKLALLFGIGTALVADEFALWLTLRDVYFEAEGAWSVELAGVVALVLAANFAWRAWAISDRPRARVTRRAARMGVVATGPDLGAAG
jgi:hypothetical protein